MSRALAPALLAACVALAPSPASTPRDESVVLGLEIAPEGEVREELFLLYRRGPTEGHAPGTPRAVEASHRLPVGVARLLTITGAASRQFELELRLFELGTRIRQVEAYEDSEAKLVWREARLRDGRSLMLRGGDAAGPLDGTEWGAGGDSWRGELPLREQRRFPLGLLEEFRSGSIDDREVVLFEPLARADSAIRARGRLVRAPFPLPVVVVDWTRPDGTTPLRALLVGDRLQAFGWESAGPLAVRTDREGFERVLTSVEDDRY